MAAATATLRRHRRYATVPPPVNIPQPAHRPTAAWLMAAALLFSATLSAAAAPFSEPHVLSPQCPPGSTFQGVRLLGTLSLSQKPVAGILPRELSGLAWDADEGLLYAVSDNGDLVHLRPRFEHGVLVAADLVGLMPLLRSAQSQLPRAGRSRSDSRG